MTNAEHCKRYRSRLIVKGLCIYGCGNYAEMPSGLCADCHEKQVERQSERRLRNLSKHLRNLSKHG